MKNLPELFPCILPTGNIQGNSSHVNNIITSKTVMLKKILEKIDINDLLEIIRIYLNYIVSEKRKKTMKNLDFSSFNTKLWTIDFTICYTHIDRKITNSDA